MALFTNTIGSNKLSFDAVPDREQEQVNVSDEGLFNFNIAKPDVKPAVPFDYKKEGIIKKEDKNPIEQLSDGLYEKFAKAETEGKDWWRRTNKDLTGHGSSAFGPVQITGKLFEDIKTNASKYGLTEDEVRAADFYIEQSKQFLKYGNEPNAEGYDVAFDYSAKGDGAGFGYFANTDWAKAKRDEYGGEEALKKAYESIASKVMGSYANKYKDDVALVNAWRYGASSDKSVLENDPEYYKKFKG